MGNNNSAGMGDALQRFEPGLEGVIAFETEIAEPDRAGSALRYRGVDIEEVVERLDFGRTWGLLVDNSLADGLPLSEDFPALFVSDDPRANLQATLAMSASVMGFKPLMETSDEQARLDVALATNLILSSAAAHARGRGKAPVPQRELEGHTEPVERFLVRWRDEFDSKQARALKAYFIVVAEHGINASTFAARVIASTGADVSACMLGAIGALSGPLHGAVASIDVLAGLAEVERTGDPNRYVRSVLDRGDRLMGFGHRVYRDHDPRAQVLRRVASELQVPRLEAALALEKAALEELHDRRPDRAIVANQEYWGALLLDYVGVPPDAFVTFFACGRTAGLSAHILEQRMLQRLVRPSALYVGPDARELTEVAGYASWVRSLGESAATQEPDDGISVVVYVEADDRTSEQHVVDRLDEVLKQLGYDSPLEASVEYGSIFRTSWARINRRLGASEVTDRLNKLERALELRGLDLMQADVDNRTATAVRQLLEAMRDVKEVCVRFGSILIVKFEGPDGQVLLGRTLSPTEIRLLERFPEVQRNPAKVFDLLSTAASGLEQIGP